MNNRTKLLAMMAIIGLIGLPALMRNAAAGQYDVPYPIVTSTGAGAGIAVTAPGSNGAVQTINTAATNGVVQTTGSGLAVNPSPVITGTANITSPVQGELGWSASNNLLEYTGTTWVLVP